MHSQRARHEDVGSSDSPIAKLNLDLRLIAADERHFTNFYFMEIHLETESSPAIIIMIIGCDFTCEQPQFAITLVNKAVTLLFLMWLIFYILNLRRLKVTEDRIKHSRMEFSEAAD